MRQHRVVPPASTLDHLASTFTGDAQRFERAVQWARLAQPSPPPPPSHSQMG